MNDIDTAYQIGLNKGRAQGLGIGAIVILLTTAFCMWLV